MSKKHHILPLRIYLGVGGTLLFLTFITVAVSYIDLGPWNLAVAMIIAGAKATLVAMIFMHLLYDNKLYMLAFAIGNTFLAIFIIFTMFDTMTRDAVYDIKGGPINKEAAMYDKMQKADSHDALPDTTGH